MLKFGIISEVDPESGLVKVSFAEDDLVSDWIPVSNPKTNLDEYFVMPDVGEHVWAIMDEFCEMGVVGGSIYDANKKPSLGADKVTYIKFQDGTVLKYDQNTSKGSIQVGSVLYEIGANGHKIAAGAETLKKIISDLIDAINAMVLTTPSGLSTAPPLNTATFVAIKNRLTNFLQ